MLRSTMKASKPAYITAILTQEDDWVIAEDAATHVTTQGKTEAEALTNLRTAVTLYLQEAGTPLSRPPHVTVATIKL
jgi:predicted RNase H-like HicB family nuclease